MDTWCPNCRGLVGSDVRYCPRCGADVYSRPVPQVMQPRAWPPQYPAYPTPYPVMPMPYSQPHQPLWTGGRIATVAGGTLMIIDGCLAIFLGIIIHFVASTFTGEFLILAAIAAIVGGVLLFLPRYPIMGIVGPVLLIAGGVWVMIELPGVTLLSIIGIILAGISLGLVLIGWKDSQQRERSRWRPPPPMAPGPPFGQPPPHEYGRGPDPPPQG